MTQHSKFHNGFQIGDAQSYSAEDFHKALIQLYLVQGGYCVYAGSTHSLKVSFSAGQTVTVDDGSAFVAGVYYNNSATKSIVLEDNSTAYTRIDRIILRVDWTTQTVRALAKRGVASATPVVPTLQQDIGTRYEVSLATIFIPPSFTGFNGQYMLDDRVFVPLPSQDLGDKNIMPNSEFLSGTGSISGVVPFPMWETTSAPTLDYSRTNAAKFDAQMRGRALKLTMTSGDDFYTAIKVNNGSERVATVAFLIRVQSGGPVLFSIDGGATTLYRIPVTQNPLVVYARTLVGSAGTTFITPHFTITAASAVFKVGQMTLTAGINDTYSLLGGANAAPFAPNNELILNPVRQQLLSFAGGGAGAEYFAVDQDIVFQGIQDAIMQLSVVDTSSSSNDVCFAGLTNNVSSTNGVYYIRSDIGRVPNSRARYTHGRVGLYLQYDTPGVPGSPALWYITAYKQAVAVCSFIGYLTGLSV